MTPRERVLAALERRQSDRLPVDLGSFHDATVCLRTHQEIGAALGEAFDAYNLYDWSLGMAFPDERLLRRFDTRCRKRSDARWRSWATAEATCSRRATTSRWALRRRT